jgi:hypothetical protein
MTTTFNVLASIRRAAEIDNRLKSTPRWNILGKAMLRSRRDNELEQFRNKLQYWRT